MNVSLARFALSLLLVVACFPDHLLARQGWQINWYRTNRTLYSAHFLSKNEGYVVGAAGEYTHTSDGGYIWSVPSAWVSSDFHSVSVVGGSGGWVVGNDGIIMRIKSLFYDWSPQYGGTYRDLWGVQALSRFSACAVGDSGTIITTANGGSQWITRTGKTNQNLRKVHFISSTTGWIAGFNGTILRTSNGGISWDAQSSRVSSHLYGIHFVNEQSGWAVGANATILHTTDGGATWNSQTSSSSVDFLDVIFVTPLSGWIVGRLGTILHTTDGGENWVVQDCNTRYDLWKVCFVSDRDGWIVGGGGTVLRTSDGGGGVGGGMPLGPLVRAFVDRVNLAPSAARMALVDSFMTAVPSVPFTEEDTIACFLYRGNSNNVSVPGDANNWQINSFWMKQLSGTDLWYYSRVFESDARLDYKFVLDGSTWVMDPCNPKEAPGGFGPNSELQMPKYIAAPEIKYYPYFAHGTLRDTAIYSTALGGARQIRIYIPPGYGSSPGTVHPVVVFHDGGDYISLGKADNVLDYLIAQRRMPPTIGVFVLPGNRDEEYVGAQRNNYAAFIANELIPVIDAEYKTDRSPAGRATVGISNGGNISLVIGFKYPEIFGAVGSFSGAIASTTYDLVTASTRAPKVYVDAGTYEGNIEMANDLARVLDGKAIPYRKKEWHEGHCWGNWRAHLGVALEYFLGQSPVNVAGSPAQPDEFVLFQNYPNPYNPSTRIRFALPVASHVLLSVYNVLGQVVGVPVNEAKNAGYHVVDWNPRLPSGIYFYHISAEPVNGSGRRYSETKRMILIK